MSLFMHTVSMKQIAYSLLILLVSVFCSCRHRSYPSELATADSLCLSNPDSAVDYLNRIRTILPDQSEAIRMYYNLLSVKAHDRAYQYHESDSLIQQVLAYYESEGDMHLLPEAYYYAGRVYYTRQDVPQALDYYQKCLESIKDKHPDSWIKGRVYSQMAYIFMHQNMHKEALYYLKKVYEYDKLRNDSLSMVYDLKDLAYTYQCITRPDSSLYYYRQGYALAGKLNNLPLMHSIQANIAALYVSQNRFEEAKECLIPLLTHLEGIDSSAVYSIAADIYQFTGKTDSAAYFYQKLLKAGRTDARSAANMGLAIQALNEKHPEEAIYYLFDYIDCENSIKAQTNMETLRKMNSLYNYRIREKENFRLKEENQKKQQITILSITMTVILFVILFAYYQYSRQKHFQLQIRLSKIERLRREQYKNSTEYIEQNKRKLKELEERLLASDSQNSSLRQELELQKELATCHNRQAEIYRENRRKAERTLTDSDIYQYFHSPDIQSANQKEWQQLEEIVNTTYPDFTRNLRNLYQFSEYEMCICLLIKINVQPVTIARLTHHSKESVTATRRRLCEKILEGKASPKRWDEFIHSL